MRAYNLIASELAYSIVICRRFAEGSGWDFRTIPVTVM